MAAASGPGETWTEDASSTVFPNHALVGVDATKE